MARVHERSVLKHSCSGLRIFLASRTKWRFSYRSVQWEMGYRKRGKRERGFGGSRWLWVFGQENLRGNGNMVGSVGYSTYNVARLLFTNSG